MLVTHSFWFCHCFDLEPLLIWNVLWIKIKHLPHARQWMQMLVGMCACRVFSIYNIRGDCWIHHQYCIQNLPIYIRQTTSDYSLEKISRCRCYYRSNESHNHTHEFTYKCDKTKYVLKKCFKKNVSTKKRKQNPNFTGLLYAVVSTQLWYLMSFENKQNVWRRQYSKCGYE